MEETTIDELLVKDNDKVGSAAYQAQGAEATNRGLSQDVCDSITLACNILGPLYVSDPEHDENVASIFQAIASLDATAAGDEWPFANHGVACSSIELMQQGINDGAPTQQTIWEFRRLFVGPNPMPAPPWGSVYTDKDEVVFGASTLELRQWMRERGIKRLGDEKTPEDQLGLMLLLLSWLAQNKPELVFEYLQNHLLTWSSHFLKELEQSAEASFYTGLARLTRSTLEGLQAYMGIDMQYPHYYR